MRRPAAAHRTFSKGTANRWSCAPNKPQRTVPQRLGEASRAATGALRAKSDGENIGQSELGPRVRVAFAHARERLPAIPPRAPRRVSCAQATTPRPLASAELELIRVASSQRNTLTRAVEKTHHARVTALRRGSARSTCALGRRARVPAPRRRLRERPIHQRAHAAAPTRPTRAPAPLDRS